MIRRFYHVSFVRFSTKKQGMKLCKMLNPKAKRQFYPTQQFEPLPSVKGLMKTKHEPGKRSVRRIAMLNHIFMKSITDLMSTGTMSLEIVGRGIEISKVNVTADFNTVNVYWVCKGNSSDDETEQILNKVAGPLRHELSTLRIMGEVPHITFVKDKQESITVDIERRLAMADFGEDYTPTDPGHLLKSEFTLNTQLSPEVKAKIKQLEEEEQTTEENIPEMTHNVYGLEHERIMNRLLAARKKSRDAWSREGEDAVISYRVTGKEMPSVDVIEQKQELADFLLKRQIEQNKIQQRIREAKQPWQGTLPDNAYEADPDSRRRFDYDYDYQDDDDEEFYREMDRVERETKRDG